ncbi:MAG: biliverdin-producing heme oxygenase [Chromatiaceae bacterium]|nr:biliverdin-producing heme oxygenase [Chromatiaceae bacterium]
MGGLADAMRERTRALHRQAERSGIITLILRGHVDRAGYRLLLRSLLPVYQALEAGLEHHRATPGVGLLAEPALSRAQSIASDLDHLCPEGWCEGLPLLASAERYRAVVADAARGDGARLIAHAYVRYLGDLSGGRVMRGLLAHSLRLPDEALGFFAFPDIADLDRFKLDYRHAIDRAGRIIGDTRAVVDEATRAFRLNIDLSEAVAVCCAEA